MLQHYFFKLCKLFVNDNIFYLENAMMNQLNTRKSVTGKEFLLSPLGWSAGMRLLWAAGASAMLWVCVAWALGWQV